MPQAQSKTSKRQSTHQLLELALALESIIRPLYGQDTSCGKPSAPGLIMIEPSGSSLPRTHLCIGTQPPSLHHAGTASPGQNQGLFCTLCRMVDHTRAQCALAYLEPTTPTVPAQRPSSQAWRKPRANLVCHSWNRSTCSYPGKCAYRHVCSSCLSPNHKVTECPQTQRGQSAGQASSANPAGLPASWR